MTKKNKKEDEIYVFDGEGPLTRRQLAAEAAKLRSGRAPHDRPGSATRAAKNDWKHIGGIVNALRHSDGFSEK